MVIALSLPAIEHAAIYSSECFDASGARRDSVILHDETVNDDASTSSTMLVDSLPSKKAQSKERCTTKSVTFCETDNIQIESQFSDSDARNCWYKACDYRVFRSNALEASQQIVNTEKRNRAPFSYQRVLERTYDVCCKSQSCEDEGRILSDSDTVHLNRWAQVAGSRHGLEKWSIRAIGIDKQARRRAITAFVLENMRTEDCEHVRESCARLSRPSCLFAVCLAQAQAVAVRKEQEKEVEDR
jgi:hypothetical protein